MGVPEVPWQPRILVDQLNLSQLQGADYAHQMIVAPPDFQTFLRPCFDEQGEGLGVYVRRGSVMFYYM